MAQQIAPVAQQWLHTTQTARVLHLFAQVCNLVNENQDVLSLTTIEAGPFAIVLPESVSFLMQLDANSLIVVQDDVLKVGDVVIGLNTAVLWQPKPPWLRLAEVMWQPLLQQLYLLLQHSQSQIIGVAGDAIERLMPAIFGRDLASCQAATRQLAGLGNGLTPAGDDFLVGVLYGCHALGIASEPLIQTIVTTAVSRTTTLSAAWLKAAARGEAVPAWHQLVAGLSLGDKTAVTHALHYILQQGHTSGADALTGFMNVIAGYSQGSVDN